MKRLSKIFLVALLVMFAIVLAAGCGASRQAVRQDGTTVDIRVPPAEVFDIGLRQERPQAPPNSPPFSVTDESAGRWLTLFEMNANPSGAAGVPPAPAADAP